jgi:hypothetical protein
MAVKIEISKVDGVVACWGKDKGKINKEWLKNYAHQKQGKFVESIAGDNDVANTETRSGSQEERS